MNAAIYAYVKKAASVDVVSCVPAFQIYVSAYVTSFELSLCSAFVLDCKALHLAHPTC